MSRLDQLQKMHTDDPHDAFLTYAIAQEHMKSGDHQQAVTWFDKTLALKPDEHYAYFHKAKALSELGEDDDALDVLRAGLRQAREDGADKAAGEIETLIALFE